MEDLKRERNIAICVAALCSLIAVGFIIPFSVLLNAELTRETSNTVSSQAAAAPWANPSTDFGIFHLSDLHVNPFYNESCGCHTFCSCDYWGGIIPCASYYPTPAPTAVQVLGGSVSPTSAPTPFDLTSNLPPHKAPFGRGGCDPPRSLITDHILPKMKEAHKSFPTKFMLITGDILVHKLINKGSPSIKKVTTKIDVTATSMNLFKDVTDLLLNEFPSTPMIFSLGNNDGSLPYFTPTNASFVKLISDVWIRALNRSTNAFQPISIDTSHLVDMYYKTELMPGLHIISMNTILLNKRGSSNYDTIPSKPQPQGAAIAHLDWLRTSLAAIKAKCKSSGQACHVMIVGHIPPIVSARGSWTWNTTHSATYFSILNAYNSTQMFRISQIYGHTHEASLWINSDHPLYTGPAISSDQYKTNPTFRQYAMATQSRKYILRNYREFTLDLFYSNLKNKSQWFEHNFMELYRDFLKLYKFSEIDLDNGTLMKEIVRLRIPEAWQSVKYIEWKRGAWEDTNLRVHNLFCSNVTSASEYRTCMADNNYADLG